MSKQKYHQPKLSIVIPVFNEGENLKVILKVLKALVDTDHEVLIVHDIPDDTSIPVVQDLQKKYLGLQLVYNQRGRGVINAVKEGVACARGEHVLITTADDIGPLASIDSMVKMMDDGCDFINGSRRISGGKNFGGAFLGTLISTVANNLFYVLAGSVFTDPTLGIKMFRKETFDQINFQAKPVGWTFSFEWAIKVQTLDIRLGEHPIVSVNRAYAGQSSLKVVAWCKEYIKWFFWGIKEVRKSQYYKSKPYIKVAQNSY